MKKITGGNASGTSPTLNAFHKTSNGAGNTANGTKANAGNKF